jgi:hypothetical protein
MLSKGPHLHPTLNALGLKRHVLLNTQRLEEALDAAAAKDAEDLVVEREEEARAAGISLAARTTTELDCVRVCVCVCVLAGMSV